ncbi:MAG: FtsX-like permease family protein [Marinoscillum sp.]|uniref:ABC transporter permease n=1 Tax=Marinoscillum sp. TaxID=2024838 RepID=UPI0032F2FB91
MIKFLLKGILGDKNRSVLPIIIITIGVSLTILLSGYLRGVMGDMIDQNARFETGHVKIMSRAYAENKDQLPNDLALLGIGELTKSLEKQFPDMQWVNRIKFGGLIDVPDGNGGSKGQGPAAGMALELYSKESGENERMNISSSIVTGTVPAHSGETLVGYDFAQRLNIQIGDDVTYMGTTMNGSMSFENFIVTGTVKFGTSALDRGAIIIDISDARRMLDMEDGAGEVLGYFRSGAYHDKRAIAMSAVFNSQYANDSDEFAPEMFPLRAQNNLSSFLDYVDSFSSLFVVIFVFAMSIVLWNTGLLGGLRRYQEFGIRLALGEEKGHIYRTLIYEAVLIGSIGSVIGTVIGLCGVYYLQVVGIDISGMLDNSTMMMPSVLRASFTADLLYLGFIPGLFAMVLGNALSGIGIYKRETATLFKELEV